MTIQNIAEYSIWGNPILNYLTALGIFLVGVVLAFIFKKLVIRRLKKRAVSAPAGANDILLKTLEIAFGPVIYIGSLYLAVKSLTLSPSASSFLHIGGIILITILVVRTVLTGVRLGIQSYLDHSSQAEQKAGQLRGVQALVNLIIWALALIFVLDNLGIKISAVAAGLGIGGIAMALAAQTVLGDLFSYFVIFFDKPFEIGDFILVGDKMGVVENIGMKTTRIKALGGEQLVFSNTDLTNSRIHNYKKMERRRVVFKLSVVYQTTGENLKKITGIVREIISSQEDVIFDRGHFSNYGEYSLNFEFVYYLTSADYNKYMDTQERINLAIFEAFGREGIAFAFPTRTLFLEKQEEPGPNGES